MNPCLQKLALFLVMCLVCLTLDAMAVISPAGGTTNTPISCTDSGKVVAPGDTISVVGPANTQSSLVSRQSYKVVKYIMYYLHKQSWRIGYEEVHCCTF